MSLSGDRLARAERRSDAARAAFIATADRLKARITPRRLLHDALDEARKAAELIAENGAETAKRHPVALTGLVAGIAAIAFRRTHRKRAAAHETEAEAKSLKSERTKPRRARKPA